jgi:peroxiredoxin
MAPACRGDPFKILAATFAAAVFLLAAAITASRAEPSATTLTPWRAGVTSDFTLSATSGPPVRLEAQRGRVVLVHFFATWCEPCREELPALRRLAARAAPDSMAVLAISVAEVDLRVQRFLKTIPVNFPVLLDRDRAVAKAWKISTLPSTVILDSNLKPRLAVEADFAWDQIEPSALLDRIKSAQTSQTATSHKEQKL